MLLLPSENRTLLTIKKKKKKKNLSYFSQFCIKHEKIPKLHSSFLTFFWDRAHCNFQFFPVQFFHCTGVYMDVLLFMAFNNQMFFPHFLMTIISSKSFIKCSYQLQKVQKNYALTPKLTRDIFVKPK